MSKEFRNTPDLWIFICVFGPENDSCLWVDILALLSEEASLSFYVYLCSSFTKARSCRKTLGEKRVESASQSPSDSPNFPSRLLSAVLGSVWCRSAHPALGSSRGCRWGWLCTPLITAPVPGSPCCRFTSCLGSSPAPASSSQRRVPDLAAVQLPVLL